MRPPEGPPIISELLPVRDELLQLIDGVPPNPKNRFLAELVDDPTYGPAVTAHGLLQGLAKQLAPLAGRTCFQKPEIELPDSNFEHWLDEVIFGAVKSGGDHIVDFVSYIDPTQHLHHEAVQIALIYGAHKAAERSTHERKFVGAIGFYTNTARTKIGIFLTANSKDHELAAKYCAELKNLETAQENGFDICVAISVSGDPQKDEDSGLTPKTLHPCHDCRLELATNPIVTDTTLVLCASKENFSEMFTRHQLLRYHHEDHL